jgi:hypothetical protein
MTRHAPKSNPLMRVTHRHFTLSRVLVFCAVLGLLVYLKESHLGLMALGYKALELFCDVVTDRIFPENFMRGDV